ncbi:hypothetical protein GUJ93_ZPchr0012g19879 [Zizania palustris]|uniref:Ionotropic glutamate receptor C-terminal domain-containing protein n=1 Tax=Zizania palustris TaxID=103762 RepID=A0A8J6BS71_ZIZPA|nr:hypothetical protein GUJ93_ZPchr0012g19879 [Zizania palustris]
MEERRLRRRRRGQAVAALLVLLLTLETSAAAASVPVAEEAFGVGPRGSDSPFNETKGMDAGTKRKLGALPRGFEKKLKIAVPWKQGFKAFLNVTDQGVSGYCIDVFEAIVNKLPHHLSYEFVVFNGTTYDLLVRNVYSGIYDAAVGDITITSERASLVDFTMPYTESGVSLLVLTENDTKSTIEWIFLKPLTWELWVATVLFFMFTALVIWMIERPRNLEYQGPRSRQLFTALYFSFSTLTFSHSPIIKSPLSKFVVVIWCFVVLVLVQSYTASLSSILTAKRLRPAVTDLDQLLFDDDYVGYQDISFVRSLLINHGFSETRLRPYRKKQEYAEALRKGSKNGGVSAIVEEIPYITSFLSDPQYKQDFQMLNRIYKTPGFGFVFRNGFPLVHNLSTAILDLTSGDDGLRMEAKWFGTADSPRYGIPSSDSTPLNLRSFSGLFIITGCISALMLSISIFKSAVTRYTIPRDFDAQNAQAHQGSNLAQNIMDNDSVPDQPHHEIGIDDSQDIHGSIQSAGGQEPASAQDGSVPANSTRNR